VRIDVFTIFPEAIERYIGVGVLSRAREAGAAEVRVWDLRRFADDPRRSVDDRPFGGGSGMVLMCEPIFRAVEAASDEGLRRPLLVLSAAGELFSQKKAREMAAWEGFSLICGRYEGIDERVTTGLADGELSVGDYVLAGGELAALVVIEAVARLLPGVLGNEESPGEESFESGLLEYPHYTRPAEFRGMVVPEILLSGDHGRIARWRRRQALLRTIARRPDLIEKRGGLTEEEVRLLDEPL
jgi:tRNA (guanine37-N1)-methyltransferase